MGKRKTMAQLMQDRAVKEGDGFYQGEVNIGMEELSESVEAARRLLDHVSYDKVHLTGDQEQCEKFGRDIIMAAELLLKMTVAVTDARHIAGSQEVH